MNDKPQRTPRGQRAVAELVETSPILSVDEVNARYTGEWVLLLVTNHDELCNASHGRVLAHHRSQARVSQMVARVHALYPDAELFPFLAAPPLSIEEFRRRVLEHDFPEEVLRAWW